MRLTKKKREDSIKSEMKEMIQLIPQKYKGHKKLLQLYANKSDNGENKCLEISDLPKLNHEAMGSLNRLIVSRTLNQKPSNKQSPEPDGLTGEFQ